MSVKWKNELQLKLRTEVISTNTETWQDELENGNSSFLRYVGGLDVSFVKDSNSACVGLVVVDIQANHSVVYENFSMVEVTEAYISGYLSFREADFYSDLLDKMKVSNPDIYPQCILIDGNGYLHTRRCGLACHIGVICNVPTIGVAKTLYRIENCFDHFDKNNIREKLPKEGDFFELKTRKGEVLGCCLRNRGFRPIYVSVGHRISLPTSIKVVKLASPQYRIPEPIRLADLKTRAILRKLKE